MKNQKYITEGALFLAIYIILLFLSMFLPFIGSIMTFTLPIPFIIYSSRYRLQNAVLFLFGAAVISFLFTSIIGFVLTILFGLSGIVVGRAIQKQRSGTETLLTNTFSYLIVFLGMYVIASSFFKFDLATMITETTTETVEIIHHTLQLTGSNSDIMVEQLKEASAIFPYLLPSFFLIVGLFLALVTQLVAYPILKRLNITSTSNKLTAFRDIMFPRAILWMYLIVLLISFIELEQGSFLYMAVVNLFYVLQFLMVIQGLSFIYYFSHQKGIPIIVPIIITILTPFLLYIIRILGIIDLGFDLRSRIKQK